MTLTRTHTKTYVQMDAWAETIPWDCLTRDTRCCSATHDHDPMVGDPCAVGDCGEPLVDGETCYAVCELPSFVGPPPRSPAGRVRNRIRWVCWRHVRPDDGPIRT